MSTKTVGGFYLIQPPPPPWWDEHVLAAYPLANDNLDELGNGPALGQYGNPMTYTVVDGKNCTSNFLTIGGAFSNSSFSLMNNRNTWTVEFDQYIVDFIGRPHFALNDNFKFFHIGSTDDSEGHTNCWYSDVNNEFRHYTANDTIVTGTWQHIALTKDGDNVKMYTDNNLSISYSNGTWQHDIITQMTVGCDWYFAGYWFNGHMANLIFSDIARTTFPTQKV